MGRPGSELGQTDPLSCDHWREGVPTAHHAAGARREQGSQSPSRGVGSEPQECRSALKSRSASHLHGDASESPPLSPWGAPPSSWEVERQPWLGDHVCREGQGRRQAISRGAVPRLASATRSCQVFSGRRHHLGSGMRPSWLGQRSAKVSSDVLSGFSLSLGAVGPAGRPSRLPIPGPQRAARRPLSELLPVTQARRPRAHWGVALDVPPWTGWRAQAGHVFWKQTIHEPASQHRRPPAAGPPAAARLPAPRNN